MKVERFEINQKPSKFVNESKEFHRGRKEIFVAYLERLTIFKDRLKHFKIGGTLMLASDSNAVNLPLGIWGYGVANSHIFPACPDCQEKGLYRTLIRPDGAVDEESNPTPVMNVFDCPECFSVFTTQVREPSITDALKPSGGIHAETYARSIVEEVPDPEPPSVLDRLLGRA